MRCRATPHKLHRHTEAHSRGAGAGGEREREAQRHTLSLLRAWDVFSAAALAKAPSGAIILHTSPTHTTASIFTALLAPAPKVLRRAELLEREAAAVLA